MNDRPSPQHDSASAQFVTFDAILPPSMAARAEEAGIKRVRTDFVTIFVLSMLAGAFISFGAIFATTVSAGSVAVSSGDGHLISSAALPFGIGRLLVGLVFPVGLILIVVGGAELFTGNNLIVMAWASRKVSTRQMLHNWAIVFAGNAIGAFATAVLLFCSTQYTFGNGSVGAVALATASAKTSLTLIPAFTLGILCNALVCLAVWMCYSARTTVGKIFTAIPPIAAFAASGFEHSIANVYFISIGLLIKAGAPDTFWNAIGRLPQDYPTLTWSNFLFANLIPVTLGNIIGGSLMVGGVYWFVYLRDSATKR
jgi:formate transporter